MSCTIDPMQGHTVDEEAYEQIIQDVKNVNLDKSAKEVRTELQKVREYIPAVTGKESELLVFRFAKRAQAGQLMATFYSFEWKKFYDLMQSPRENQEFDFILVLRESSTVVHIEVASGGTCQNIKNKCKQLKKARDFMQDVFDHLGIGTESGWHWKPYVAVAQAQNKADIAGLLKESEGDIARIEKHVLTRAELISPLQDVLALPTDRPSCMASYVRLVSSLAAAWHLARCKSNNLGGLRFHLADLLEEASSRLAGTATNQPGFNVDEPVPDKPVSWRDMHHQPLAGFRGIMFWNRQQVQLVHDDNVQFKRISGSYGSGKTLLLVFKAISKAKDPCNGKIVFISALRLHGIQDILYYVFEEKIRQDLASQNVIFYSLTDIQEAMGQECKQYKNNRPLCNLLLLFIKELLKRRVKHIFIDELPAYIDNQEKLLKISHNSSFYFETMIYLRKNCKNRIYNSIQNC